MKTAIVNIGPIVSGDLETPLVPGDTILLERGLITRVGTATATEVEACDVVVDACGAVAIPGLIDSHVHTTFGDFTPRQNTVGFLESYVHGGVTTAISASEVHVPGRPSDPAGVKALAIAAHKCFEHYRPGGMRVWAGSLILEPGLQREDLEDVVGQGVWLAKAGFGAFPTPYGYTELVAAARALGMITMVHTGGASIPGSSGIWAEHLLQINPDVSYHVNGGPVAMPDADFPRLVNESTMALQICTAGNLRTALLVHELLSQRGELNRLLIATDTPTGSGIMPLGMIYTMSHLASLGGLAPELAIAAATGNNARVFRRHSGLLREGRDADVVLIDACAGGSKDHAFDALRSGDPVAVTAVFSDGTPRFVGRSRNTPAGLRPARVVSCRIPMSFGAS